METATADTTIPANTTATLPPDPDIVDPGVLTVQGILNVNSGGVVSVGSVTSGGNIQLFNIIEDGGVLNVDGGSVFINGDTQIRAGSTLRIVGFYSNRFFFVEGPESFVFINGGQFLASSSGVRGAAMVIDGGSASFAGSGLGVTDGFLQVSGTGELIINPRNLQFLRSVGRISDSAVVDVGSSIIVAQSTVTMDGGLVFANILNVFGPDSLFFQSGGTTTTTSQTLVSGAVLQMTGGSFQAQGVTVISNNAYFEVSGAGVYTASGSIFLESGGIVAGTGLIDGGQTLNNTGGTVSPGQSLGVLSFVGNYVQGPGGNFRAEVQPGVASDLFLIFGNATLAGNVEIALLGPANLGTEQFRIIISNGPITTPFESISVTGGGTNGAVVWVGRVDNNGVFNEADPSTGNNVDVIIGGPPANLPNLNPNQMAIAQGLGSGFVGVPAGTVVVEDAAVYNALMVSAVGRSAIDQLNPEVYDSFTAFSFNIARQFGGLVDTRVRTLRCASAAGPSAPFCGSGRTLLADGNQRADAGPGLAPGAPGTTSPNGFSPNTHPYGWSVWAQVIGSYISLDQTSTNLGYSGWTGGGAMGVDLALSQRWIVGVLAGGTRSNIDFSGVSGDGDLDAVTVGVYTAWYGSRWFANAAFTYTKTWVEADRDLTFMAPATTARGKTEGDQYAIHSTIGYGFKLRRFSLEATGGVDWVQLRQYGFTETGAGAFNLTVGSRTDDSLRLRAGIRVARAWKVRPNLIISPSLRVGYAREVLDNTRAITSTLAGFGGSFTVNGDEGSRNILTYGGGIQADFSQGITLYFLHSGEWAGDRTSHTFNGGIKVRW